MARWQRKRWRVQPWHHAEAAALGAEIGCSAITAGLLLNRGVDSPDAARHFLTPSWEQLADPFLLPDAEAAAERLKQALGANEKIAIHGDYDGDGVTSAALWMRLLSALGADVSVHVPHRGRDGYDMRSKFVAQAKADGVGLIVTTDCGIRRCEEVDEAREAGIDCIVTDHHVPGDELPRAIAVVNPHRRDSRYPFTALAGVGVAFRTGEALARHLGHSVENYRRAYCDLAAIGTVTDMMPLLGENRVLVKYGLRELAQTRKLGLRALINSAHIEPGKLNARALGFALGPRLNAAGRLDDSRVSLDLLLTRDLAEAEKLAAKLEQVNNERRTEQARVLAEALEQVAAHDMAETACLVMHGPTWHTGVVGLVANQIVQRFNRPAVLLAVDEETGRAKGSARSIRPFDIFQALTACGDHLIEFGGHSHAAGMSLELGRLSSFAAALNRVAASTLTEEDFVPTLEAEMEIDPAEVTYALVSELAQLEPWGMENEEPLFVSRGVDVLDVRRIGKEQQHLKLIVRSEAMNPTDALFWNMAELADHLQPGDSVDLCYRPGLNAFNGSVKVQFTIEDLRPSGIDDW